MFKLFSMSVHTSRLALGAKVTEAAPNTWQVGNWGDIKTAVRVGHAAAQAVAAVAQASADLLRWAHPDAVAAAWTATQDEWLRLMEDVGIRKRQSGPT
jgi:hypothetical protein